MAKKKSSGRYGLKDYIIGGVLFYLVTMALVKLAYLIFGKLDFITKNNLYQNTAGNVSYQRYIADLDKASLSGATIGAIAIVFIILVIASFLIGEYYFLRKPTSMKDALLKGVYLTGVFVVTDAFWYVIYGNITGFLNGGWSSGDLLAPIGSSIPIIIFAVAIMLTALAEELYLKKVRN